MNTIKEHKPRRNFSDTRHFLYIITPEMQEWYSATVIKPCVELSIKQLAILISSDFYAQLSIEQLMDEDPSLGLTTQYFEEEQKAFNWIAKA